MAATVVLGIGNTLWGDDGFGVAAARRLAAQPGLPPQTEVVDGGTQGLYLLPIVQEARNLLVLDCVDFGAAPGAVKTLRDAEIPRFFDRRPLSLHQTAFTDVLFAAELTGAPPDRITLIGAQYEDLERWGGGLTPSLAAALDDVIELALAELHAWSSGNSTREVSSCPTPTLRN